MLPPSECDTGLHLMRLFGCPVLLWPAVETLQLHSCPSQLYSSHKLTVSLVRHNCQFLLFYTTFRYEMPSTLPDHHSILKLNF